MSTLLNLLLGLRPFLSGLFLLHTLYVGATDLKEGDLAITSINTDALDEFSFVLLTDITGATTVYFTENGWHTTNNNWHATGEGTLVWSFSGNLSAGTEVQVSTPRSTPSVSHGSITKSGSFSLSSSGDGLIAYTGTGVPVNGTEVTNFIWMFNTGTNGFQNSPATTTESGVPRGLTDGINALDFPGNTDDNFVFECSSNINTISELRTALADPDNFSTVFTNENLVAPGCQYLGKGDFTNQVFWLDPMEDVLVRGDVNNTSGNLVNVFKILEINSLDGVSNALPTAISIDESNGKIYWTDRGDVSGIYRSDLDGRNTELYAVASDPQGIYVDDTRGYIYYTDDANNEIRRLDLVASAGSTKNEVTITGLSNLNILRGVVYDAGSGRIFWTDNAGNGGDNQTFHSASLISGSVAATGQVTEIDMGSGDTHSDIYFDEVNRRIFLSLTDQLRYYEIDSDQVVSISSPTGGTNMGGITADATNGYIYVGESVLNTIARGDYPQGGNASVILSKAGSDPGTDFPLILTTYTGPVVAPAAPTSATAVVKVFLEGAYNGVDLSKNINSSISLTQPYNINGHTGGVASSIPADAVDWVLVELREASSAVSALSSAKVGSAAGFLMDDGSIKATDGTSNLTISLAGNTGSEFFVVIYHRNHLPIMSASAISESSSLYTIDFTNASANTYLGVAGLASLSGGKFGMLAGDADGDGDVDATDLTTWQSQNGTEFTYGNSNGDFNLDGVINAVDRNDFQQKNESKTSKVPTT